jgi:hypothetical protein
MDRAATVGCDTVCVHPVWGAVLRGATETRFGLAKMAVEATPGFSTLEALTPARPDDAPENVGLVATVAILSGVMAQVATAVVSGLQDGFDKGDYDDADSLWNLKPFQVTLLWSEARRQNGGVPTPATLWVESVEPARDCCCVPGAAVAHRPWVRITVAETPARARKQKQFLVQRLDAHFNCSVQYPTPTLCFNVPPGALCDWQAVVRGLEATRRWLPSTRKVSFFDPALALVREEDATLEAFAALSASGRLDPAAVIDTCVTEGEDEDDTEDEHEDEPEDSGLGTPTVVFVGMSPPPPSPIVCPAPCPDPGLTDAELCLNCGEVAGGGPVEAI